MAASIDEILAEMRRTPKGVRFTDACKVATHRFGEPRQNGTSHKVWKMPWQGDPRINLQAGEGGNAKPFQVRQVLAAVDRLVAQQAAPAKRPLAPGPGPKKTQRR